MNKFEDRARDLKLQGNNCSYSVYNVFEEKLNLNGKYPGPRSIEGKCGALLSAIKILEETGNVDRKEEFEQEFIKEFGYLECSKLIKYERRCNDYVGWSVNKICEIIKLF